MLRHQPSAPGRFALGQPCQYQYSSTAVYPVHGARAGVSSQTSILTQACGAPCLSGCHICGVGPKPHPGCLADLSFLSVHQRRCRCLCLHTGTFQPACRWDVNAPARRESENPPPPPPPDTVSGRVSVCGGGAVRHNLSNVLNVTMVIHGGHNSQ